MSRRRILLVTSRFPYPVIAGDRLRIFNLAQQLGRRFRVTLLALGAPEAADLASLRRQTGVDQVATVPHGRTRALAGALAAALRGEPLQAGYYASAALARQVAQLLPAHDAVIFHLIRTSAIWQRQAAIPAVLEMCDAISANFEQTAREGPWWSPWRQLSALEAPRTAAYERREMARFDLVTLHTQADADRIDVPADRLLVSTQGVDAQRLAWRDPATRNGRSIALIGKMDFFPNRHGAEWFGRQVLPLLPADITLKVVGDCSPKVRARLARIPRLVVTGRVESIDSACADCFAAVAPMHVATGVQNKVLEYFAMGLPTVMTPSVAGGLLASAEGGYAVAATPAEWAGRLAWLAEQPAAATAMARHARQYVRKFHSWDSIGAEYCARLEALMAARQGGRAEPVPVVQPELHSAPAL